MGRRTRLCCAYMAVLFTKHLHFFCNRDSCVFVCYPVLITLLLLLFCTQFTSAETNILSSSHSKAKISKHLLTNTAPFVSPSLLRLHSSVHTHLSNRYSKSNILFWNRYNRLYSGYKLPFIDPKMHTNSAADKVNQDQTCTVRTHPRGFYVPVKEIHYDVLDSTQKFAAANIPLLVNEYGFNSENWIVITAAQQTAGIGTRSPQQPVATTGEVQHKKWVSEPGNLLATYVVPWPTDKMRLLFHFSQVSTLAVSKTLHLLGLPKTHIEIKWINDVWVNKKKICGVLCQSPGVGVPPPGEDGGGNTHTHTSVLIGVGLNVNLSEEACRSIDQPVTSLKLEMKGGDGVSGDMGDGVSSSPSNIDVQKVTDTLSEQLYTYITQLERGGFAQFLTELNGQLALRGDQITVDPGNGDGRVLQGVLEGLNADGSLRIKNTHTHTTETVFTGHIIKHWVEKK
eukprot:GDKI01026660.1.p1 GENE.GDKI01026660.1~~GDKI01026660.1.p1  ORF type:complete len:454 (+),score=86.67 GDKI01026660.1:1-1362(+)